MRTIVPGPAGSLTLEVSTAGPADGPVALLLHGFPQTSRCWHRVAPLLSDAGVRVLAPDQRGYSPGARPDDVAAYRLEHLVADALAVLDAAGAREAVVVGHDWGALVGWALAAAAPERVRALVAVSVPHPAAFVQALREDADQKRRSSYIALFRLRGVAERTLLAAGGRQLRLLYTGSALSDEEVDAHVAPMLEDGALGAALAWYRAQDVSELAAVPPVRVPTTYLWGRGDAAVGATAAAACPGHVSAPYRFVELPQASHWVPDEAPGAVADAVLGHLGRTSP